LRQAGVPAYPRNTDDYRLTPCTALVEGCVASACRGRETSNYRLGSLLRQWRSIQGTGHSREQDAASPEPSAGEEFQPTAAAASPSAAPASARKVHVVLVSRVATNIYYQISERIGGGPTSAALTKVVEL
jgi:hypothetical protein